MALAKLIPDRLCEWFSDMNEFSDCCFTTQYPAGSKTTPLTKPVVVFGTKSVYVYENTVDSSDSVETETRLVKNTFAMSIHVPRHSGGTACYDLFERLTDLLLYASVYKISEMNTYNIDYIRNTDSLHLEATFSIKETLEKSGENYPDAFRV